MCFDFTMLECLCWFLFNIIISFFCVSIFQSPFHFQAFRRMNENVKKQHTKILLWWLFLVRLAKIPAHRCYAKQSIDLLMRFHSRLDILSFNSQFEWKIHSQGILIRSISILICSFQYVVTYAFNEYLLQKKKYLDQKT